MNQIAYDMIKRHEGLRLKPYKDTKGLLTIGVGRNLDGKGITAQEADMLYRNDLAEIEAGLPRICPSYASLSLGRQAALMDLGMIGFDRLVGFKKLFLAISHKDWNEAANQIFDSKWRLDVGTNRANDVCELMRNS